MQGTKTLYLPDSARPAEDHSEVDAEQRQMAEEMEDISGRLAHFTRELQNIFNEPYVKVILAKPKTTVIGLKGGYYHIVRIRPGTAAWVQPYEGPDGEWRDLDSGIVDVALQA